MGDSKRKVDAAGNPVVFELEQQYGRLEVTQRVAEDGSTYYHFHVTASRQGEGTSAQWSCKNKWRCINAGKNKLAELCKRYNYQAIRAASFRRYNRLGRR